ncbi:lycopene cyclase family protein [Actinocatenispora rupis]|uniref:Lycopene cyclase n=1 Tax=Actinocatenispora rupis TaxID=519421 RepID=A0A8J3J1D0_9ACTN|nr:lycopene cyclase family protein [Actinocatenispora rupis]GID10270.1 lycopene cyclase [Actinocatenispora rupis]
MTDVDLVLVGGGGAAHCLLHALGALRGLRVAVVDPVRHSGNDRTWCFWDRGRSPVEQAVTRRWSALRVVGPDGAAHPLAARGWSYALVRSADLYALARERAAHLDVTWYDEPALDVRDGAERARVTTPSGELRARWVFDSRPLPPPPRRPLLAGRREGAETALLQHFRGWWLSGADVDPDTATLMDFAVPQPPEGLAFGYVLPVSASRALVEYTVFSRHRLPTEAYDVLRGRFPGARVESTEDGAIPMTDAAFPRRTGRRVFRLGTGGGATRPATGYTFRAMLRQAASVAADLAAGRVPLPPRPYPRRHLGYDAVLLRALDRGLVDGRRLLTDLLAGSPDTLAFLDGTTTPRQELSLLAVTPRGAMARATAQVLRARLTGR